MLHLLIILLGIFGVAALCQFVFGWPTVAKFVVIASIATLLIVFIVIACGLVYDYINMMKMTDEQFQERIDSMTKLRAQKKFTDELERAIKGIK